MGTVILFVDISLPVRAPGCVIGSPEPQFPAFLMGVIDATQLRTTVGQS